jgi:hypothetical protein
LIVTNSAAAPAFSEKPQDFANGTKPCATKASASDSLRVPDQRLEKAQRLRALADFLVMRRA